MEKKPTLEHKNGVDLEKTLKNIEKTLKI